MRVRYVVIAAGLAGAALGVGITWADFGGAPPFVVSKPPVPLGTDGAPRLAVDKTVHDFGVIDRFNNVRHTFRITNVGTGTLTLKAGTTTCTACTIAEVSKEKLAPGESSEVVVDYSPRNASSEFEQYATILSNDPEQSRFELKIMGSVRRKFLVLPDTVILSNISASEPFTTEVKFISLMTDKLKVVDYKFEDNDAASFFEAKIENIPLDELIAIEPNAKSGCRALVTVKPGLPVGPFRQAILLACDTGQGGPTEDFEVPIEGLVVSDVSIVGPGWHSSAGVLTLGKVSQDQGTKRELSLLVRGENRHEVEIEPIKLDPPWLRVTIGEPTDLNPSVVRIPLTVEIPPDSPSAIYQGTNQGKRSEITLGIKNHPDAKEIRMYLTFVNGKES